MNARPDKAAHRPLEPFTIDHYRRYARLSVLDDGEPFEPQEFQLMLVEDLFQGFAQNWWVIPEGNGKTTFLGHLGLYYGDYTPSAMIPIAASSREQAEIMYRQAEGFVYRTPGMRERFKCQEGYRRIKCLRTGGRLQVYAADDRTGDGIIPGGIALLDELHRHRDLRLYRTWVGKLVKRGAQMVAISTAGEPASEFEETRERIHVTATDVRNVSRCHLRAASENIVLHDFRVPSRAEAADMAVVADANPRKDITAEVLRKKRDSPTMTEEHWLRFVCNIATRASGQAITPEDWDPLRLDDEIELDVAAPSIGWLDLGWKIDTTAMGVLLWPHDELRIVAGVKVLEPPVDEGDVVAGLLHIQHRFPSLRGFAYDENAGGQQMAQLLSKGQHPLQTDDDLREAVGLPRLNGSPAPPLTFFPYAQDNAPMALAASRLDEAIRGSDVRPPVLRWAPDGDWQALRRHALNVVRKAVGGGEKWRYDRPADAKGERRRKYPNDALIGLAMGYSVAVGEFENTPMTPFFL